MRWPLLAAGLIVAAPAWAQRVELPIRQVTMSDHARRYAVTVLINGQPVEVGLDTGSTGLRVLAASLPGGAGLTGEPASYGYGSGVRFAGPAVKVSLGFGSWPVRGVRIQRIDSLACSDRVPACAASKLSPADYRIMGDGIAGQGFVAILGIGLHDDPVPNPLLALGIRRWIVELPRAEGQAGRLVLDPTADEIARNKAIRLLPGTNMVVGCVTAVGSRLCAPTMIDSGAAGIRVQGGREDQILAEGTQAQLVLGDGDATAAMPVTVGRRDQAAGMRLYPARTRGQISLSFGIAPYLHWSVLYDADKRTIGVADRQGECHV